MPATLGRFLVFNEDGRDSHLLIDIDRVGHVLHIAVAIIVIDEHRKGGRVNDLPHCLGLLAEADQVDVRNAKASTF